MYPIWKTLSLQKFQSQNFDVSFNQIDIWKFDLDKPFVEAFGLLNPDEQKHASSFYQVIHQKHYTSARALTKLILSKYLKGMTPLDCHFFENAYGKPKLSLDTNLEFNLSHSGNFGLLGISYQHPIGIDLEIHATRPFEDVAQTCFSNTEIEFLKKQPHYLKSLSFFNIWSQKEAFIKAIGMGLSYPTTSFTVTALPPSKNLIPSPWQMTRFTPHLGYSGAICHTEKQDFLQFYYLRI